VLIVAVYFELFSTVLVDGVVDHKEIVGISDQTSRTLLVITPWGVSIEDPSLITLFQSQGLNLTVNETLDRQMQSLGYSQILYLGGIRVSSNDPVNGLSQGETLSYFVTRDDFNKLIINGSVSYEVDRFQKATIREVHD